MRLGIVRLSAIGDVIHAMPLAMGLRQAFPGADITWVVQEAAAPLLSGHPAVDAVLLYPRHRGVFAWFSFVRALRAKRFDTTVDSQGNLKSGMVGFLSGAAMRCGLHPRDCKERGNAWLTNRKGGRARGTHGVDRAWAAGEPLGVLPGPDRWGLRATDDEVAAWRARCPANGKLLAMHLTDPDDARSWFAESWAETARRAVDLGYQVVLNGTAARRDLAQQITGDGIHDLTGQDDLRGLLAQFQDMASCPGSVLVSPDSGPSHLAVAAGLPVVCLSGPQDPQRTGPRVGRAVTAWEGLPCAPCIERKCQLRPPDRTCMRHITPKTVLAAVAEHVRE